MRPKTNYDKMTKTELAEKLAAQAEKTQARQRRYLSKKWQATTTVPREWADLVSEIVEEEGMTGYSEYFKNLIEEDLRRRGKL